MMLNHLARYNGYIIVTNIENRLRLIEPRRYGYRVLLSKPFNDSNSLTKLVEAFKEIVDRLASIEHLKVRPRKEDFLSEEQQKQTKMLKALIDEFAKDVLDENKHSISKEEEDEIRKNSSNLRKSR